MFLDDFKNNYSVKDFFRDALIGVLIALVSIPISMGYAQVAGIGVKYGLYGSFLPILIFGLISSSRRFVFGVDAAPAALVGGLLASLGIASGSAEAEALVPVISACTALWLLVFFIFHFDRLLKFISESVMGGFITGIGVTIILMQVPKLFGGTSGSGEIVELIFHSVKEACTSFNLLSFVLGAGTVLILLVSRRFIPKFPMQPCLMFLGAALTFFLHLEDYGVKTLPAVSSGFPEFSVPDFSVISGNVQKVLLSSLTIAMVILSETLLASTNLALKNGEKLIARREILAYALGNASASCFGCCPVNGSVSRSGIASQFGVKSQIMSITASFSMLFILLWGTGFIQYLPVPVLTGIVIAALCGTLEFSLAHRLRSADKAEFFIFCAAFVSVLILGTVYGVLVGVLLASITFILRQTKPSSSFLGVSPEIDGFHSMAQKNTDFHPLKHVVIFRFSGPLFYANIGQFCSELEEGIKRDTKVVVVDSAGIGSIDVTAAGRLMLLRESLEKKGIKLYLAGHVSAVNDMLLAYGAESLVQSGAVRSRIELALSQEGINAPYEMEDNSVLSEPKVFVPNKAEFEWAYGKSAEKMMDRMAEDYAEQVAGGTVVDLNTIRESSPYWSDVDEETFLDLLERHLAEMQESGRLEENTGLELKLADLHARVEENLLSGNRESLKQAVRERFLRDRIFKMRHPKAYEKIIVERERLFGEIAMNHPELARTLAEIISEVEDSI